MRRVAQNLKVPRLAQNRHCPAVGRVHGVTNRPFRQVDVFGSRDFSGNPLAVVLDADGLADDDLRRISTWTNLSECTFVLPPTEPDADYRVRIFSLDHELPFAGHPTLGTARAWLDAGGVPARSDVVVQQCGIGLVPVRIDGDRLAFEAPALLRDGPVEPALLAQVAAVLGVPSAQIVDATWADNGPGWIAVLLGSAADVLALRPSAAGHPGHWDLGVVGPHPAGGEVDWELRAFFGQGALIEDPVTGSLNASVAQWLLRSGRAHAPYVAAQGTAIGREGRIGISTEGDAVWVAGRATVAIRGELITTD